MRATKAKGGATAASAAEIVLPVVTSAVPADREVADAPEDSEAQADPAREVPAPVATAARVLVVLVVLAAPVARVAAVTVVPAPAAARVSHGIPARDPVATVATADVVVRISVRNP